MQTLHSLRLTTVLAVVEFSYFVPFIPADGDALLYDTQHCHGFLEDKLGAVFALNSRTLLRGHLWICAIFRLGYWENCFNRGSNEMIYSTIGLSTSVVRDGGLLFASWETAAYTVDLLSLSIGNGIPIGTPAESMIVGVVMVAMIVPATGNKA
jgi:hypothetical protein